MKTIGRYFSLALLFVPLTVLAENEPKSRWIPDDTELPPKFGISLDYFAMEQPYSIQSLTFSAPGLAVPGVDTSGIAAESDIQYMDVKIDVWVLPYLNLFAILGRVDGTTTVDFTAAGLPLPVKNITVDIDGTVYGAGATLAIANELFFGSLTATYTKTELRGGGNSSLTNISVEPRIGIHRRNYQLWIGGFYLKTDEKHAGTIPLSLGGPVPTPVTFDVTLEDERPLSPTIGGSYYFNKHFNVMLEAGFGDRKSFLASITYRL